MLFILIATKYLVVLLVLVVTLIAMFARLMWMTRPVEGRKAAIKKINSHLHTNIEALARSQGLDMRKGAAVTCYQVKDMPLFEHMAVGDHYKLDTWFLCSECETASIITYQESTKEIKYCPSCGAFFMHQEHR